MGDITYCELKILESIGEYFSDDTNHFYCAISINKYEDKTKLVKPDKNTNKVVWNQTFTLYPEDFEVDDKCEIKISVWKYNFVIGETKIFPFMFKKGERSIQAVKIDKGEASEKFDTFIKYEFEVIKKTKTNKNFSKYSFKFIEYFLISRISESEKFKKNKLDSYGDCISVLFKCPSEDRKNIPLINLAEIKLFMFPSNFVYRSSWAIPSVFHFTLTLNEQKIYGSSLIFYKKLETAKPKGLVYEPFSMTILSRNSFLEQFSATLKYVYLSFFHLCDDSAKVRELLDTPKSEMHNLIDFLCNKVPPPLNCRNIVLSLKSLNSAAEPLARIQTLPQLAQNSSEKQTKLVPHSSENTQANGVFPHAIESEMESIELDPQNPLVLETSNVVTFRSNRASHLYSIYPEQATLSRKQNEKKRFFKNIFKFANKKIPKGKKKIERSYSNPSVVSSLDKDRQNSDTEDSIGSEAMGLRAVKKRERDRLSRNMESPSSEEGLSELQRSNEVELTLSKNYEFFSLPVLNVNLRKNLFDVLDLRTIVNVFSAVLCEVSLVFYSSQISLLMKIQECFKTLLFPFNWRHVYIPNLPKELLHIVDAPVPYMVGIHKSYYEVTKEVGMKNKAMFVDIDASNIMYFGTAPLLPSDKIIKLSEKLRMLLMPEIFEADSIFKNIHDKYSQESQSSLRKAFLSFLHDLMGDYRSFLKFSSKEIVTFDSEVYLHKVADKNKAFYKHFFQTHIFSAFLQKHIRHPALMTDCFEYICCSDKSDDEDKEIFYITVPIDTCKSIEVPSNDLFSDKVNNGNKNYIFRDSLLEKSKLEKAKEVDFNRLSLCLKSLLFKEKAVSDGELASISELLKIFEWREFFLGELIIWIKNPIVKKTADMSEKEIKKLKWLKSLSKIGIKKDCFENLTFLLYATLTECHLSSSTSDFRIAKTLLDAATIFYNESSQPKNTAIENFEFAIRGLLCHELLKNKDFWMSILVNEINLKFINTEVDPDWCFQRIIRYAHQIVDLNSLSLDSVLDCIDFWCVYCNLNLENKETLKKAVKNLEASKNMRISEYINGGHGYLSNFEFIDKFGKIKLNLMAESKSIKNLSKTVRSKKNMSDKTTQENSRKGVVI